MVKERVLGAFAARIFCDMPTECEIHMTRVRETYRERNVLEADGFANLIVVLVGS